MKRKVGTLRKFYGTMENSWCGEIEFMLLGHSVSEIRKIALDLIPKPPRSEYTLKEDWDEAVKDINVAINKIEDIG